MKSSIKLPNCNWIILIIAIGLTMGFGPFEKAPIPNLQMTAEPREYMKEVSVWTFTQTGKPKHHLVADAWVHIPETAVSTVTSPFLIVYKPDETIWKIHSKQGTIRQPVTGNGIEQIELSNTVVLNRPQTPQNVPLKLETEMLRYEPQKQFVETESFVTITRPDLKITGIGMRGFLENSYVELLENVKTFYESTIR